MTRAVSEPQTTPVPEAIRTRCCVVGGGPAGMMHAFLLARAGVEVTVLEKHGDFFRDFRGDTIHPSTLELMEELGFLEDFLKLPHQEVHVLRASASGRLITLADLGSLPTRCKFIAIIPQWDFLNFLAERARRLPGFSLRLRAEATDLIFEGGRVAGVRARTPEGILEVRCDLVIGADGRHSITRERAQLRVESFGVPIDVLWLRIPKGPESEQQTLGFFEPGRLMVLIARGDYYQCGYVIRKGEWEALKKAGIDAFRASIVRMAPMVADGAATLRDWDQVKLLSVSIDRLERWHREGLLCIGDAAHAMSPAGGVGINLAIQDAVAAANELAEALARGPVPEALLRNVQTRREPPMRKVQRMQVFIHRRMFGASAGKSGAAGPFPAAFAWILRLPPVRHAIARVIGLGFLPEHIRSPVKTNT